MKLLITGGAGFVGSQLALAYKKAAENHQVVVFDNLKRRGSELNLPEFKRQGITFIHGDIRQKSDLEAIGDRFDLFIDASAEPSVLAGLQESPSYLLETNIVGTMNCLEFARHHAGRFIFLSTSRVYSIDALRALTLTETPTRLSLEKFPAIPGVAKTGISEAFSTAAPRSLYGTSKLASEMLVQEYGHAYNLPVLINRCGVLAGPGQFGKADQGVFTLWMAHHWFQHPLTYKGFGGTGKQVRDLLHPRDLYDLLCLQWNAFDTHRGNVFCVGGGVGNSISLLELTELCRKLTGRSVSIAQDAVTNPVDIPWFVSDSEKTQQQFHWSPKIGLTAIFEEILYWIKENDSALRALFSPSR